MQELQVLPVRTARLLLLQRIVSTPERSRRIQILAIHVAGEGARLPHQPVDHVPIIDAMLRLAAQPFHRLHPRTGIPHLDRLGAAAGLDQLAAQPRRHRVSVLLHPNRGALAHPHPLALQRFQSLRRQRTQLPLLLRERRAAARVAAGHHVAHELPVRLAAGEVAAATQQQFLRQHLLETPMRLLAIAILMAAVGVGGLGRQAVVTQQRLVACRVLFRMAVVMHRQGQAIGAMPLRHAAQFPQGVLQAVAQTGKALRKAQRHALPVRAGQHEVIDQVCERLPGDGDVEALHVREVRRSQPARRMLLAEEQLLGRSMLGLPLPHPPFHGATLPLPVLAGVLALQPIHQRLGLQAWLTLQQCLQPRPHFQERIGPGAPGMFRLALTGQPATIPILSSRLAIHACLHRCLPQRPSLVKMATKLLDLRIADLASLSHGNSICLRSCQNSTADTWLYPHVQWGRLIVASGEG